MTEAEAQAIAESQREAQKVPPEQQMVRVQPRYIELEVAPPPGLLVRDALVHIVRFQAGPRFTELAVEQRTGTVVRVERSRS